MDKAEADLQSFYLQASSCRASKSKTQVTDIDEGAKSVS